MTPRKMSAFFELNYFYVEALDVVLGMLQKQHLRDTLHSLSIREGDREPVSVSFGAVRDELNRDEFKRPRPVASVMASMPTSLTSQVSHYLDELVDAGFTSSSNPITGITSYKFERIISEGDLVAFEAAYNYEPLPLSRKEFLTLRAKHLRDTANGRKDFIKVAEECEAELASL